jgi:nucleoside-diphosphate-sugar epimerase
MAVVILRPALVYGESPKGNLLSLARGVRRGLPRPPAGGGRSMVALADLVDLLCLLADNPPPGVNTWIVSDGASHSTREIYDLLRAAMGKGRGTGWLPHWGWRLGAWLLDQTGGVAGDRAWDKLFGAECYSNDAVVAATGWRPVRRLEDLVADMVIGREKPA